MSNDDFSGVDIDAVHKYSVSYGQYKEALDKIAFLENKIKWLLNQIEHLEIQLWGSR